MKSFTWLWLAVVALAAFASAQKKRLLFYGSVEYREWQEAEDLGYEGQNLLVP